MKEWTPTEIKAFRQRLNLYQKDFAAVLRVTEQYICNLEKGVKTPGDTLRALLDCLEQKENEKGKEVTKRHGKTQRTL
ncbi:helix-turn-helix domain-containing protein [Candidatus Magnetominusculus dajiuhuensis]|uniref:helix-turn-helix domain-containing protein n=1 Tax=Candidatus Magnetominusculus dajiuhuensis TaxID=3137712 RepID=UPI003B42DDEB